MLLPRGQVDVMVEHFLETHMLKFQSIWFMDAAQQL